MNKSMCCHHLLKIVSILIANAPFNPQYCTYDHMIWFSHSEFMCIYSMLVAHTELYFSLPVMTLPCRTVLLNAWTIRWLKRFTQCCMQATSRCCSEEKPSDMQYGWKIVPQRRHWRAQHHFRPLPWNTPTSPWSRNGAVQFGCTAASRPNWNLQHMKADGSAFTMPPKIAVSIGPTMRAITIEWNIYFDQASATQFEGRGSRTYLLMYTQFHHFLANCLLTPMCLLTLMPLLLQERIHRLLGLLAHHLCCHYLKDALSVFDSHRAQCGNCYQVLQSRLIAPQTWSCLKEFSCQLSTSLRGSVRSTMRSETKLSVSLIWMEKVRTHSLNMPLPL